MSESKNPDDGSLLGREARGGEIAERGFKFQDEMILARIPTWLAQHGFSQMIRESLGDAEARFFDPGCGEQREFNEYKDHRLTPGELWPEIDQFWKIEEAHPNTYRRFRLVCPDVNDELKAVCRALDRVRDALPFYDGVSSVEEQAFDALASKIQDSSGKGREYAEFVFKHVDIEHDAPLRTELAAGLFQRELTRALPECRQLIAAQFESAANALRTLVADRLAKPIQREELEAALRGALPGVAFPSFDVVRVHTASAVTSTWDHSVDLLFRWEMFSGGAERTYPGKDAWHDLVQGIGRTRDWIVSTRVPRRVHLDGTRRLSCSVALGAAFSAVSGFSIDVENRGATLSTAQHADSSTPRYEWEHERLLEGQAGEIAVVVAAPRAIVADVRAFLGDRMPIGLSLHSAGPMLSAQQMNLAVQSAKTELSNVLSASQARVVHLFLAVPGTFALFLGHRLNATCTIQCYEYTGVSSYTPTCRIECR